MQRKTKARKWRKKYPVSEYIRDALKKLLPPEDLSSEARERGQQDVIRIGEELLKKKERVSLPDRQKTF